MAKSKTLDAENLPAWIQNEPPSVKLIIKILQYEGCLTQAQIIEKTYLSARTVRYALSRLRENDAITEEVYIPDARKKQVSLAPPFIPTNQEN